MRFLHPNHPLKTIWDVLVIVATVIACVESPLRITLNYPMTDGLLRYDLLVSLMFVADVMINFVAPLQEGKKLITDPRMIAGRYLRGWFVIDLLSALPFDLLLGGMAGGTANRMLRLLRLTRLLRLVRLAQFMRKISRRSAVAPGVLRMAYLVFWILMAAHFTACIWLYLGAGNSAGTSGNYAMDDSVRNYVRALYWVTTTLTTIGYGDIAPVTNVQTVFTMFVQLMGAGMYGFVIGNIANLIANLDVAKAQHREKMEKIATFMKYKSIPADTQNKVEDYYGYLWETRRGYNEFQIVEDFPRPLRAEVLMFLNREMIQKVPIFEGASLDFLTEIVLSLKPVVYPPGSYVFKKGSVGRNMYFISRGTIEVVSEDGETVFATLTGGNFFGEIALLLDQPRTASIRSADYSDLYTIDKETFERVLKNYPEVESQIQEFARKRQEEMKKESAKRGSTPS
ncbi:MAG: ion transporter [Nitrospirae bacterium]|nr:ion transporter [Nitrospirota bacterium]